jgi:hypothetical protein
LNSQLSYDNLFCNIKTSLETAKNIGIAKIIDRIKFPRTTVLLNLEKGMIGIL